VSAVYTHLKAQPDYLYLRNYLMYIFRYI